MAFDESLTARIRDAVARKRGVEEKKDVRRRRLPPSRQHAGRRLEGSRSSPASAPTTTTTHLLEPHVREFDITGTPMKGWVPQSATAVAAPLYFGSIVSTRSFASA